VKLTTYFYPVLRIGKQELRLLSPTYLEGMQMHNFIFMGCNLIDHISTLNIVHQMRSVYFFKLQGSSRHAKNSLLKRKR